MWPAAVAAEADGDEEEEEGDEDEDGDEEDDDDEAEDNDDDEECQRNRWFSGTGSCNIKSNSCSTKKRTTAETVDRPGIEREGRMPLRNENKS